MNDRRKSNDLVFALLDYNRRPNMKTCMKIGVFTLLLFLAVGVLWAGDISGGVTATITTLNTYVAGAPASAEDVNQNFALVRNAINDNDARLDAMAAGGVTSAYITNGTITGTDVGTDTLTATNIAAGAIGTSEILDGSVASADILDGTIASLDILDGTIAAADIANAVITGAKVAPDTLTATNIAASAVSTSEILDLSIVNADISASAAISANKVASPGNFRYGASIFVDIADTAGVVNVYSSTITIPAAGYVMAIGSGDVFLINWTTTNPSGDLYTGISSTSGSLGNNMVWRAQDTNYMPWELFCVTGMFYFSSGGQKTIYITGDTTTTGDTFRFGRASLLLWYVPNQVP